MNLATLNGPITTAQNIADEVELMARVGKKGPKMAQHLRNHGLELTELAAYVLEVGDLAELPTLDGPVFLRFSGAQAARGWLARSADSWATARPATRRKNVLKAIQSAITQAGPSPSPASKVVSAERKDDRRQGISLSKADLENIIALKARMRAAVSVEDLLRAGLLGLLEFDDDELNGLVEEIQAVAGATADA